MERAKMPERMTIAIVPSRARSKKLRSGEIFMGMVARGITGRKGRKANPEGGGRWEA